MEKLPRGTGAGVCAGREMKILPAKRYSSESFERYKARRKSVNTAVKRHPKGRMAHVASQIVELPMPEHTGPEAAEEIRRGNYCDLVTVVRSDGALARVGRTKGVAYKRPADYVHPKGRGKRRRQARKVALPLGEPR